MKIFTIISLFFITYLTSAKSYKIAVLYWSMDIEGQVAMRKGLEEKAKDITQNTEDSIIISPHVAGNGRSGTKNQIEQFNSILKNSELPDLIIVQPTDNSTLIGQLQQANKLKVPVIAYDQYILGGELLSFITSNNYKAGKDIGEYIDTLYDDSTVIKLVLVEYPRVTSTIERVEGFIDGLKQAHQKYKIIKSYSAVEPKGGKIVGAKILKDFPIKNSIDVIFTINDGGGLPIVEALKNANRKEIKVATIDGDPISISNIKNNHLTVINSAQFCAEIGRKSLSVAYDFLKGKKVSKRILIPTFPVTKNTIKFFTGMEGILPKEVLLPWSNKAWDNQLKSFE